MVCGNLQVDHVDSPTTGQPSQVAHLPRFAGERGLPQSSSVDVQPAGGEAEARNSRPGSLGV